MAPLFVPKEVVAQADLVLLFGGFQQFHPEIPDSAASASRVVLERMREALADDPWKVIENFRRRCVLPGRGGAIGEMHGGGPRREGGIVDPPAAIAGSEGPVNIDLLSADLDRLDSEEIDLDALSAVPGILVLHGTGDRIVPHAKGEVLARILGDAATFLPMDGAGHALPFTHSDEIWKMIAPHVNLPELR
jgi:pimeloyl-ACP methyl ester carboxylesterase